MESVMSKPCLVKVAGEFRRDSSAMGTVKGDSVVNHWVVLFGDSERDFDSEDAALTYGRGLATQHKIILDYDWPRDD